MENTEIKAAINYLRPIADNASLPNYAHALDIAIRCMEEREAAKIVAEAMLADLKEFASCKTCTHNTDPVPCENADYICYECTHHGCVCRDCEAGSKWEWRGVQEVRHGQ